MKLIKGKDHLYGEYQWIRGIHSPQKIVQSFIDVTHIQAAVAGTKPMILGNCIWGSIPGRSGVFTFYTHNDNVEEMARLTDGVHYFWSRLQTKRSKLENAELNLPTLNDRGRPTSNEPWHGWSEEKIKQTIYNICVDLKSSNESTDVICLKHGLHHWGFRALFELYGIEYYEWTNHQKLPENFNTTERLACGSQSVSFY